MAINKAFKDVYGKFLTEQGYQYCAKLQRLVKVVNQELIYFIPAKQRAKCELARIWRLPQGSKVIKGLPLWQV